MIQCPGQKVCTYQTSVSQENNFKQKQLSIPAVLQCSKITKLFIIGTMHGIPPHSCSTSGTFDLATLDFTSASKQANNLVASPLTKKRVDMHEFAWQIQLTGACKRTETDQLLQLQMHGCKCQMLPRAPLIQ